MLKKYRIMYLKNNIINSNMIYANNKEEAYEHFKKNHENKVIRITEEENKEYKNIMGIF